MVRAVQALAAALDEASALHARLIELMTGQRRAVAAGQVDVVELLANEIETTALRLGAAEDSRQAAAAGLADHLGLAATKWSVLRPALDPVSLATLEGRIARLEKGVRDLELANAINGRLIRRELDLVDFSIRGLLTGGQEKDAPRYTSGGRIAARGESAPVLLNITA